jgi:caffeoyl-CoA O-methyltransferase
MADSPKSIGLGADLHAYLVAHGSRRDAVLERLAADTAAMGQVARMQIAPEQGELLTMLAQLVGARLIVEVGTFTGYSSLCIARGLADGGRLVCCDVSDEWTSIGRRHWEAAGVADRIDLRIAPAAQTLEALPEEPHIDLCFIDADKGGYATYWDLLVPRVRAGGVLLVDNVLWGGRVVDPVEQSADTVALRAFNDKVAADDRVDLVLLSVADGLTFAVKR